MCARQPPEGIFDFGFWIFDFGFWIFDFGFWILDFGFWIFYLFITRPNLKSKIIKFKIIYGGDYAD